MVECCSPEHFQALEAIYTVRNVAAQDGINAFTLISAYLVVAYLVGPKLSKFQVWAISIIYTAFLLGPIAGFYVAVLDLKAVNHGGGNLHSVEFPWIVPLIMLFGWALSIAFMIDARKKKKTADE